MAREKWFPLQGTNQVAHWGFVFNRPESPEQFVTGELLLRSDGKLYRRYSRSTFADGHTTYKYSTWAMMDLWGGGTDAEKAKKFLQDKGFRLCRPFVSIEEHHSEPIPGPPGDAEFL